MTRRLAAILVTAEVGFTESAPADEAATRSRLRELEGNVHPLRLDGMRPPTGVMSDRILGPG
jgi:hypothetical protein